MLIGHAANVDETIPAMGRFPLEKIPIGALP